MGVPAKVVKFVVEWHASHGAPFIGMCVGGVPVA
jgi:hypothetical protein